uniref:Uncharacterized protein n=1 Tax=Peronospora matthiolae TaxID=2874970 RepID=A0AAV1T5T4_9STRA
MSPTTGTTIVQPPSHVLLEESCDWKLQRKLKHHQRDVGRRTAESRAEPRFKHHEHHRVNVMRLEKAAWLPVPTKSACRSITEQLRSTRSLQLSRSGPSATSWPPALLAATDEPSEAMESLTTVSLASSAPSTASFAGDSDDYRRGARHMTLFESARIFNESGRMLSHDEFGGQTSSPEVSSDGTSKRKFKRRGGRRKHESVRTTAVAELSIDEVVLELLFGLFPDVEVTQELNRLLLGGAQHEDVFHFDDDDDMVDVQVVGKVKGGVLDIDLLKFQAALTSMLCSSNGTMQELPPCGTAAKRLQERYFTPHWIAHEMLATVKLSVLAQYDRFAVMSAIFCSMPALRSCVLAAAVSTSLAIFQHQSLLESAHACSSGKDLVTAKGILAFLKAALDVVERDARYNVEVFGSNNDQIRDNIEGFCSQIMRALQLLVRSSHGGNDNADSNRNRLEVYLVSSDSAEATTYRAMGELMNRVAAFSPMHGEEFIRWMSMKWPRHNVHLQLFFVRFTGGLLLQFMQLGLNLSAAVVRRVFTCIEACIQSTHFLVAQEACNLCGNFQLMSLYLSRDQVLREKIASALHANAISHWNKRIREISDECFDRLLDLA